MKEAKEESVVQVLIVMILADIAKGNIGAFEPFIDDFMNPGLWQPMSAHSVISILQSYALVSEVGLCLNLSCVCILVCVCVCVCVCAHILPEMFSQLFLITDILRDVK